MGTPCKCGAPALVFAHWPSASGPTACCLPCGSRAFEIARVMGFALPLQPVDAAARVALLEELSAHHARERLK